MTLQGLILSTGAVTAWLVVRDTDTANQSGARVIDRIPYIVLPLDREKSPTIPFPIFMRTGLTVELNSTAGGETATVIYTEVAKP